MENTVTISIKEYDNLREIKKYNDSKKSAILRLKFDSYEADTYEYFGGDEIIEELNRINEDKIDFEKDLWKREREMREELKENRVRAMELARMRNELERYKEVLAKKDEEIAKLKEKREFKFWKL